MAGRERRLRDESALSGDCQDSGPRSFYLSRLEGWEGKRRVDAFQCDTVNTRCVRGSYPGCNRRFRLFSFAGLDSALEGVETVEGSLSTCVRASTSARGMSR